MCLRSFMAESLPPLIDELRFVMDNRSQWSKKKKNTII